MNYALLFNGSLLVFGLAAVTDALARLATDGATLVELIVLGAGLLITIPAVVALYRGDDPFVVAGRRWLAVAAAVGTGLYLTGLGVRYLG